MHWQILSYNVRGGEPLALRETIPVVLADFLVDIASASESSVLELALGL